MTEADELRVQLRNAMKARALVYAAVYDELESELGAAKAEEILKRAIYQTLRKDPRVADIRPGEPARGGDGVAIVDLK